jgi:hypothetical protein
MVSVGFQASKEFPSDWTGQLGTTFGENYNTSHYVTIADGYQYASSRLEKKSIDGSPNVYINATPSPGATDTVSIGVHVGLSSGENIDYRVVAVASPTAAVMAPWNAAVENWRQQKADADIQTFLEEKRKGLAGLSPTAWPPNELMRRIIADYFGIAGSTSCELVQLLHRVFEWENLSATLYPPWWDSARPVDGLQSLRTTFLNASWAKVFVPIRLGFEEEALSYLLSIGALPITAAWLDDVEFYLRGLRNDLEPQYQRLWQPGVNDSAEVDGPADVLLTPLGSGQWDHGFESGLNFTVLDRHTVTIPTDGVDFEEAYAICPHTSPRAEADTREAVAEAGIAQVVERRLGAGDGAIQVQVTEST